MAGRNKLPLDEKKIQLTVNRTLKHKEIAMLGGIESAKKIFQDAGNKEIDYLLFLKSKIS